MIILGWEGDCRDKGLDKGMYVAGLWRGCDVRVTKVYEGVCKVGM